MREVANIDHVKLLRQRMQTEELLCLAGGMEGDMTPRLLDYDSDEHPLTATQLILDRFERSPGWKSVSIKLSHQDFLVGQLSYLKTVLGSGFQLR